MPFISEVLRESSLTGTVITPEVLAAVFGVTILSMLFIVKLMAYFRVVLEIAFFSYPNALVTVKGNPCIETGHLERIAATRTIAGAVEEARRLGFDLGTGEPASADEVERALLAFYHRECENVLGIAPDSVKPLFRVYCMGEEAAMIRRAIRARHAGLPAVEAEAALQPVGFVTPDLIHRMAAAQTMDDLVSLFRDTPYGPPLSAALDGYHEIRVPFPLESALDRMLYEELEAAVMLVDASHLLPVTGYAGAQADNTNVKILLRAKRDRLSPDRVAGFLVGPGTLIPQATLRKMAEAPSVEEIIVLLEGTGMRDAVVPAAAEYHRTGHLTAFEKALDEFLLARLTDLATVHRYGPGPLISFLVARKFEVQNLRAIVWGVRAGLERDEIAPLLVYGQVGG